MFANLEFAVTVSASSLAETISHEAQAGTLLPGYYVVAGTPVLTPTGDNICQLYMKSSTHNPFNSCYSAEKNRVGIVYTWY